jgi:hypothetical protein
MRARSARMRVVDAIDMQCDTAATEGVMFGVWMKEDG